MTVTSFRLQRNEQRAGRQDVQHPHQGHTRALVRHLLQQPGRAHRASEFLSGTKETHGTRVVADDQDRRPGQRGELRGPLQAVARYRDGYPWRVARPDE